MMTMEAVSTSETSVNLYHTTRRYNGQQSRLCTCRRKNLKPHNTSTITEFQTRRRIPCVADKARLNKPLKQATEQQMSAFSRAIYVCPVASPHFDSSSPEPWII
jgi:hypothetical protein